MLTYLLDTSAWLAHVFNEPGRQRINIPFVRQLRLSIVICGLSLIELQTRLKALDRDGELERLWTLNWPLFDRTIPVDKVLATRAIALRRAAASRLPGMDALIAAPASLHEATLVHRDPHFTLHGNDYQQLVPMRQLGIDPDSL